MSEPIILNNILKGSTESSSLASSDRILAVDSNGDIKRVSRSNLINQDTYLQSTISPGESNWLRVAELPANASGILKISIDWGGIMPAMIVLSVMAHCNSNSACRMQCISRLSSSSVFSKARIVRKANTTCYLDIYAPLSSASERFKFSLVASNLMTLQVGSSTDATIPDGYTAIEFDFTTGGG